MTDPWAFLTGIPLHKEVPDGETSAGVVELSDGRRLHVLQRDLDRLRNMPSAEEIQRKVAAVKDLLTGGPTRREQR